jgi:hypothetical protein
MFVSPLKPGASKAERAALVTAKGLAFKLMRHGWPKQCRQTVGSTPHALVRSGQKSSDRRRHAYPY